MAGLLKKTKAHASGAAVYPGVAVYSVAFFSDSLAFSADCLERLLVVDLTLFTALPTGPLSLALASACFSFTLWSAASAASEAALPTWAWTR